MYVKMGFLEDLSDASMPDSPTWLKHLPLHAGEPIVAPDGTTSRILVRDTWNTDIIDALKPHDEDLQLYKPRYSAFFGTDLDEILRARGVDHLVMLGATTSVCVESTVREAIFRDYHCVVLEECTAEPIAADASRSNHDASILVLELLFASISDSGSLLRALDPSASMVPT